MAVANHAPGTYRFATFEVDVRSGELRKQGVRVRIQEQPFRLLTLLLQRPGEVLTREELRREIWQSDTFIDFDKGLNTSVNRLREALGDSADNPRFVETIPKRGYRFIAPVTTTENSSVLSATAKVVKNSRKFVMLGAAAILVLGIVVGSGWPFRLWRPRRLNAKDMIVLADFMNNTGDPVFDGALRQGLAVQLEQSPFLGLVSEEQVQQTLRMMKQPADARLTPEIAWEICQRTNSTIVLDGSISQVGSRYELILRAFGCLNGDHVTSTEAEATDKTHVLEALDKASSDIRRKLGESLSSVQKFDTPLEQASTSSLDALRAYSLGYRAVTARGDSAAAKPFFQQAVALDPNFAMAHVLLGTSYWNLGENALASDSIRRAFELRAGVSEHERLRIETEYRCLVTCDLLKAQRALEVWEQTYPRDWSPRNRLGLSYLVLGQQEQALAAFREALNLYPHSGLIRGNLIYSYIALNRLSEAHAAIEQAKADNPDAPGLRVNLYRLAFLENNQKAMQEQVDFSVGKPGLEDEMLWSQAETAAYSGQFQKARSYYREAMASAARSDEKETAAAYETNAALTGALFGYRQRLPIISVSLATGPDILYQRALILFLTGDLARASSSIKELEKRSPEDTVVQFLYLPVLRAQVALSHHDAPKALEELQAATPYELSAGSHPVYFRGLAYLIEHDGDRAAAEFRKILDHPGIVLNSPISALARLQLGRALVMSGNTTKARSVYQEFFAQWQNADSDLPILRRAKSEYAKLQ